MISPIKAALGITASVAASLAASAQSSPAQYLNQSSQEDEQDAVRL